MRIHIIFPFHKSAGGGKSFLLSLRRIWRGAGYYAERPADADAFLFNSHHDLYRVAFLKMRYWNYPFIHRVDGPMGLYTGRKDGRDKRVRWGNYLASGTIYQSRWSQAANYEHTFVPRGATTVIWNAADPELFYRQDQPVFSRKRRTRLIATSWSANPNKGFDVYQYLDQHLDFSQYEMTFIGNSPISFRNITMVNPVPRREVGALLRHHDIYIAASQHDPCSNALLEALTCGLPAVARASGGHPELVQRGGKIFDDASNVLSAIDDVRDHYAAYRQAIACPDLPIVAKKYVSFIQAVMR